MGNDYKGIVSFERPDGSKTTSECMFNTEWLCANWVFDQITNIHKYSNASDAPNSIVGEIIGGGKHVVYNLGYEKRKDDTIPVVKPTVKHETKKNTSKKANNPNQRLTKRVYMYWNEDTHSILGTYSTTIASDVERNGWTKLYRATPHIVSKYFGNCSNWFVAKMSTNGNYVLTKVDYKPTNNHPDDFKNFVRSIL